MYDNSQVDFAISYAGEDAAVAKSVAAGLREKRFRVFLAYEQRHALVGEDGEAFFEDLFTKARQVVVLVSRHYRKKEWTRFEWDIISKRQRANRFIPVRLDNTRLKGLSSNVFYIEWTGKNIQEIVDACATRLLLYENSAGIGREGFYEEILREIRAGSRGALAKAYQLVKDKRKRTPLDDAAMPPGEWQPCYTIVEAKWNNFGVVSRRAMKVRLPYGLTKDEVIFNLKHCCVMEFNAWKPDAVSVCGYTEEAPLNGSADIAVVEFAPFGDWGRAEEGVAHNIPTSEFDFRVIEMSGYPYEYAGSWKDMPEAVYQDFINEVAQRRSQAFSRRQDRETDPR